jgi:hypothetical protein
MRVSPLRRFHYRGTAHALSMHFHRPLHHLIEVQAPTSLPTTGGHGNARVDNFRFNDLVSFKAGYTHVSGSEQKDGDKHFHTTLVTSVVEGLNILDVITADRVVARLSASHAMHDLKERETRINLLGSTFDKLRILGCPVNVTLHHELFLKLDTFKSILDEFATNPDLKKIALDPFGSGEKQKKPDTDGVLLCSLVKDLATDCPGVTRVGQHGLEVPKFGRIFLSELIAEHGKRTLTMLRLELGSPVEADGTVAQIFGNGHTWP